MDSIRRAACAQWTALLYVQHGKFSTASLVRSASARPVRAEFFDPRARACMLLQERPRRRTRTEGTQRRIGACAAAAGRAGAASAGPAAARRRRRTSSVRRWRPLRLPLHRRSDRSALVEARGACLDRIGPAGSGW